MASIREVKKNGKVVSYRFTVCLERDAKGKQIRSYKTWNVPDDLTSAKARKMAEIEAYIWEEDIKAEYQKKKEQGGNYAVTPEKRKDDFVSFVNDIWFTLYICNGDRKQSTIVYYSDIAKHITKYFGGVVLQNITSVQIQQYLQFIRNEHEQKHGKPISYKHLNHYYGTLKNIFNYAERNDMIIKNPMTKVEPPKKIKKPVDAFNQEEAKDFFRKISDCPLDFKCMLHLFITTGLRRGEIIGLQWKDIDEKNGLLHIDRGVVYVRGTGIIVSTPKTASSIRVVPLANSSISLLKQLYKQIKKNNPNTILKDAFIFSSKDNIFAPRDPNAVTRRVKRFMKNNHLPDNVSP